MKKVELFVKEEGKNRELYVVDKAGIKYRVWTLGYGIPVSLIIETEEEAHLKAEESRREDSKRLDEYMERERNRRKTPWYKKIFK